MSCITLYRNDFTLKFCDFEAEGENEDQFCFHSITARLRIDIKLSLALTVGDGWYIFEFLFITQSNFQSNAISTHTTVITDRQDVLSIADCKLKVYRCYWEECDSLTKTIIMDHGVLMTC